MWTIDKKTNAISMHKGDTGSYYVTLAKRSGTPFVDGDVAIWTVKQGDKVKLEREFPLDDDEGAGNGRFLISFRNSDTDKWASGGYTHGIKVVLNAKRASGEIADGDTVRELDKSRGTLTIMEVLKEV